MFWFFKFVQMLRSQFCTLLWKFEIELIQSGFPKSNFKDFEIRGRLSLLVNKLSWISVFSVRVCYWKKICCLLNTFWVYQHRVKSASFQFYSRQLLTIFNQNILYYFEKWRSLAVQVMVNFAEKIITFSLIASFSCTTSRCKK